jgi:hypothetical protein
VSELLPETGPGEPLREVDLFSRVDLLDSIPLSACDLALVVGEGDREGRRRTGARGERLRRGDNLARLGGDPRRIGAGERLRGGERDLARLGALLRLLSLSRANVGLYDLSRGS